MIKTLTGLLPLAVGIGLYGFIVWFLIGRDIAFGQWLLAALLVAPGLVHMMFAVPRPAGAGATGDGVEYPFDVSTSWLVRGGLDSGQVQALVVVMVAALVLAFALAGLATVGVVVPPSWWGGLVVLGSVLSLGVLVVAATPGFVIGYAIDATLILIVLGSIWSPATPLGTT